MSTQADIGPRDFALNRLLYAFYLIGFLFVGGGFVLLTSGMDLRLTPEPGAGSLLSQSILAFFYCTATVLLLANDNAWRILRSAWPLLLLPFLALVSVAWSADPFLSFRRASAFAGTILFGLSLGAAYGARDAVGLVARGLGLACVFSVVVVFVAPLYGVHQPGDAIQATHAGRWRGIFGHRNTLGLWAGVSVAVLVVFGRYGFSGIAARALALLVSLACLAGADSGAGFAICAIAIVASALLFIFLIQPPPRRRLYIFIVVAAAILVLLLRGTLEAWSLELLGKTSNLTGRTLLWYYIIQIVERTPSLFGGGYFVGFFNLNSEVSGLLQTSFGSAHNGYLETFVYMGYVGLGVCIFILLWLAWRACRWMLAASMFDPRLKIFPLVILLVVAVHNFVESTIILPNNLNAMLTGILAGMLALPERERELSQEDFDL